MSNPKENRPKRTYEHAKLAVAPSPGLNTRKKEIKKEKQITPRNRLEILHVRKQDIPIVQVALITGLSRAEIESNHGNDDHNSPALGDEKLNIEFTNSLLDSRMITKDISIWQELHRIYESNQRPLPGDIFDQIRLEALLSAFLAAESNLDPTLLNQYRSLVDKMDSVHFASKLFLEEKFIKSRVCKEWRWDGVDREGRLYRDTPDGRGYEFNNETDEKGKLQFLTVKSLRKTGVFRSWETETPERYKEMEEWDPSPEDLEK